MTILKSEALASLKPGAEFVWTGTDWSGLDWKDSRITKPTEAEVNAEVTRLTNLEKSNEYQRTRASQYPSLEEQLDLQYWDQVNGTTKWKEAIAKIKSDNPKP